MSGEKSEGEPARITRFEMQLTISGDFDDGVRQEIAHRAEEICTVSNTLRGNADFNMTVK